MNKFETWLERKRVKLEKDIEKDKANFKRTEADLERAEKDLESNLEDLKLMAEATPVQVGIAALLVIALLIGAPAYVFSWLVIQAINMGMTIWQFTCVCLALIGWYAIWKSWALWRYIFWSSLISWYWNRKLKQLYKEKR